ncbi:MAG: hypothetical protein ACR2KX_10185, partial [Chitinophagaceae bacterium]
MEAKLTQPESAEKAKRWQPKAAEAQKLSAGLNTYLENLKGELKKEADLKMESIDGKQVESYREDNLDAATRLFDTR